MTFLDKLDYLMKRENLNKHTLALKSGVPYTTIVGLYERGSGNARLSTVNKLCEFFKVPLDYLTMDKYDYPENFEPNGNTASPACKTKEEVELLLLFRSLSNSARGTVLSTVRGFAGNPDMQKQ